MDNSASSEEQQNDQAESGSDASALSNYVSKMETEENIKKLAAEMAEEWIKAGQAKKNPDLPFSKFQEKLKNIKNQ